MSEIKKPFDVLIDDISKGFDLVPAIKVIARCDSISALNALKKVIDRQIEEILDKENKEE